MASSQIKRILMTADTVGGVWTFALDLAEALGQSGIEVILATLGGLPTPTQWFESQRVPNLRLIPSAYKLEWMQEPWADVDAAGEWLRHLETIYSPDLIHFNSYGPGVLEWRTPVVLTVHSCVASWWQAVKGEPLPVEWNRYRSVVEQSLKSADFVVAPTAAMFATLPRNYRVPLERSRVIPNGRRGECFARNAKQPFVLTVGRLWDEAKNVQTLVRAAQRFSWPLYLGGDHRHPNGTLAEFGSCAFLGKLSHDQLAGWYSRAAIYASPARYEPFGLSALEAAFSGCALVLGDIPTLREIWRDAAVFVPPDNSSAIEMAIQELIDNPQRRETFASRAFARARQFTAERMAAGYLDVYRLAVAHALSTRAPEKEIAQEIAQSVTR